MQRRAGRKDPLLQGTGELQKTGRGTEGTEGTALSTCPCSAAATGSSSPGFEATRVCKKSILRNCRASSRHHLPWKLKSTSGRGCFPSAPHLRLNSLQAIGFLTPCTWAKEINTPPPSPAKKKAKQNPKRKKKKPNRLNPSPAPKRLILSEAGKRHPTESQSEKLQTSER